MSSDNVEQACNDMRTGFTETQEGSSALKKKTSIVKPVLLFTNFALSSLYFLCALTGHCHRDGIWSDLKHVLNMFG